MTFEPLVSLWLIVVAIVSVTTLLITLEIKKVQRFRSLRIAATLSMMVALTMILLRPSYHLEKSSPILLLTEGYSKPQVDSMLSHNRHITLMHFQHAEPYKNSKPLASYELADRSAEIQFVVGHGLPFYNLPEMGRKTFRFLPSTWPTGITALFISPINIVHKENVVSGTYNSIHETASLYLTGPAGKEDSVRLSGKGYHDFKLSFVPKQSGEFTYSLLVKDSNQTREEVLPIHIEKERPLQILFLQHHPTFETQYLKTFLQQKNHSIILRYQVSKNNFRYEFINHDRVSLDQLTSTLLDNLDLVIADSESLSRLSAVEKNNLEKSIESGLGLLSLSAPANDAGRFFPFQTLPSQKDTSLIRINKNLFNFRVPRFRVTQETFVLPLLKNRGGLFSGYAFKGAGRIGFQLLQETYPLVLAGDSLNYAALWSPLLEQVARLQRRNSKIKIVTPFPWFENEPIDIEVLSTAETISVSADRIEIPLSEDINVDNVWSGRMWVDKSGWHRLQANDGSTLNYFVSKASEWRSLCLTNQMKANALAGRRDTPGLKTFKTWRPIPPLFFYLMFVISAATLWLAPKL